MIIEGSATTKCALNVDTQSNLPSIECQCLRVVIMFRSHRRVQYNILPTTNKVYSFHINIYRLLVDILSSFSLNVYLCRMIACRMLLLLLVRAYGRLWTELANPSRQQRLCLNWCGEYCTCRMCDTCHNDVYFVCSPSALESSI